MHLACSGRTASGRTLCLRFRQKITFQNDHINAVHSIYISTVNTDEWGDPLNYAIVKIGSSVSISFEKFASNGAVYDIAVLEDSDMLYEFYEVPLAVGDTRLSPVPVCLGL